MGIFKYKKEGLTLEELKEVNHMIWFENIAWTMYGLICVGILIISIISGRLF